MGAVQGGFFEGLCAAPKLTLKEQSLRHTIRQDTTLQTKQTSLQHKIEKHQRTHQQPSHSQEGVEVFRERVIV